MANFLLPQPPEQFSISHLPQYSSLEFNWQWSGTVEIQGFVLMRSDSIGFNDPNYFMSGCNFDEGDLIRLGSGSCNNGMGIYLNCFEFAYDFGDCEQENGSSCMDCLGQNCSSLDDYSYLGNGHCDNGGWSYFFNCPEFNCDGGDCIDEDTGSCKASVIEPCVDCQGQDCMGYHNQSLNATSTCNDGYNGTIAFNCPKFGCDWGACFHPAMDECLEVYERPCLDCYGQPCFGYHMWIGDGYCDGYNSLYVMYECEAFNYDGGDCNGGECELIDCNGQCFDGLSDWLGDGLCDDGFWGYDFNCEQFNCDEGDCECEDSPGYNQESELRMENDSILKVDLDINSQSLQTREEGVIIGATPETSLIIPGVMSGCYSVAAFSDGEILESTSVVCACTGFHGDANQDEVVDVGDILLVVNHILEYTMLAANTFCIADINQNGELNVTDIIWLINIILADG